MASYTTWKQDDWMSRATPLVTILLGVFATAWLLPKCISYVRLAAIPIIGADIGGEEQRRQAYLKSARKLYNDGYKKVGNSTMNFGDCLCHVLIWPHANSSKMASSRSQPHGVSFRELLKE